MDHENIAAKELSFEELQNVTKEGVAMRLRRRLQPAGGEGDKVFPPTYEGSVYALEERVINGERRPCVLLDSVQSQANRMELALLEAHRGGAISLPILTVDFAGTEVPEAGQITSLEAPHRMADAILRDSSYEGKNFRESTPGKALNDASLACAEGLLLFGLWDSTSLSGGSGAKFQRAIVSEIVGVGAVEGRRPASRIDPLQIQTNAGPLYATQEGGWTLDEKDTAVVKDKKGKPVELKPSEVNHGNVTPSLESKNPKGGKKFNHGGVTMEYAFQSVVISLPALRRLHFSRPLEERGEKDPAAWTALAALGLCGATLAMERGCDLRSRCLLVPEGPALWEILKNDGTKKAFTLNETSACALLNEAGKKVKALGLGWHEEGLTLTPQPKLVTLVKRSRELRGASGEDEGEE